MKKINILIIVGLAFLINSGMLFAQEESLQEIFSRANQLYENGDYPEAITEYKKIIGLGYTNGNLYYNVGNAYLKQGEIGQAIANYERAGKYIPRDGDLSANYDYAVSFVKNGNSNKNKFIDRINQFNKSFTFAEVAFMLSLSFFCLLLLIGYRIIRKKKKGLLSISMFAVFLFLLLNIQASNAKFKEENDVVVIEKKINARFEPFEEATSYFVLYEGQIVHVIGYKGYWTKIRRYDGKKAWVKTSQIEII